MRRKQKSSRTDLFVYNFLVFETTVLGCSDFGFWMLHGEPTGKAIFEGALQVRRAEGGGPMMTNVMEDVY